MQKNCLKKKLFLIFEMYNLKCIVKWWCPYLTGIKQDASEAQVPSAIWLPLLPFAFGQLLALILLKSVMKNLWPSGIPLPICPPWEALLWLLLVDGHEGRHLQYDIFMNLNNLRLYRCILHFQPEWLKSVIGGHWAIANLCINLVWNIH